MIKIDNIKLRWRPAAGSTSPQSPIMTLYELSIFKDQISFIGYLLEKLMKRM